MNKGGPNMVGHVSINTGPISSGAILLFQPSQAIYLVRDTINSSHLYTAIGTGQPALQGRLALLLCTRYIQI